MLLDWSPLWLSLRYAGWATLLAMLVALPLAWLLARRRFPGSELLDAVATLPLLLPPAVLVYYLLVALGRWPLHFSWHTAVGLSAIYTLPLMLRMIRARFGGGGVAYLLAGNLAHRVARAVRGRGDGLRARFCGFRRNRAASERHRQCPNRLVAAADCRCRVGSPLLPE